MLSAIGLALDCVGAVAVVLALRKRTTVYGLYGGADTDPTDYADGIGLAAVGLVYLPLGFVLQSLQYFGVVVEARRGVLAAVPAAALIGGALVAFVLYGVTYHLAMRRKHAVGAAYVFRHKRRGLRFWHWERERVETPDG